MSIQWQQLKGQRISSPSTTIKLNLLKRCTTSGSLEGGQRSVVKECQRRERALKQTKMKERLTEARL